MSHAICLPWNINTPWNLFYHKTCVSLCNICRQNNAEKTSASSHSILTVTGSWPCDLYIRASKAVICSTLKCVYLCNVCWQNNNEKTSASSHSLLTVTGKWPCDLLITASKTVICSTLKCVHLCVMSAGKTTIKNISVLPQPPYSDRRLTLWLTHQSVQGCNHGLGKVFCLLATGKVETIHLTIVAPLMEGWGGLVVLQPFQDGTVYHHLKQAQGCYTSCSSGTIQWDPKERGRLTWKLRTFCIFYYAACFGRLLVQCPGNRSAFFASNLSVSPCLGIHSLPMKRWKNRLACVKMAAPTSLFFLTFKHWFFFF